MSVMKLGSEQYLYLALSHKIDNYTTEEKYNIFRNLNILGLCERYDDLFIDSWQPSEEREKFKNVFEKFSKKENSMTKIYNWDKERNTLQNLVDDFGLRDENTNLRSLLYNSFSLCNEYQKLYIIDNKDRYEHLKNYKNLRSDEKDFMENYEYIVNNKDKYSKTMQISNLKEEIIKRYEERQKRWKELFGADKEDEKNKEEYIKHLSKEVAKECILKGLANDYRYITSHLTYETINQFLSGAYEKAEQAANEILNSDKQVNKSIQHDLEETNKEYKTEIDKVLDSDILDDTLNAVRICKTPEIYGKIGLDDNLDMLMTKNKIRICNTTIEDGGHGITREQLYNLPKLLEEPAIILKSQNKEKSVIAFVNDIDQNKIPIMISIYPNGKGTYNFEQVDSNFITSVYGRNNFKNFINNALNENRLLFTDQKVINELEKKAGIEIFKEKQVLTKNDIIQWV